MVDDDDDGAGGDDDGGDGASYDDRGYLGSAGQRVWW